MQPEIQNWNDLAHVDDVAGFTSDDAALFEEIREVLKKHDALTKYGVCLLHKHFELKEDEVLLETCDSSKRVLTVRPVSSASLETRSALQTIWSLANGAEAITKCRVVCHKDEDGFHEKRHWP